MRRKPKKKSQIKPSDLLVPIDITKFGTGEDPCFGKHHDLTAEECQRCGDQELCQVIKAQVLSVTRKKLEKKHTFKDTQEISLRQPNPSELRLYIKWILKKKKRVSLNKLSTLVSKKFDISLNQAEEFILTWAKHKKKIKFSKPWISLI